MCARKSRDWKRKASPGESVVKTCPSELHRKRSGISRYSHKRYFNLGALAGTDFSRTGLNKKSIGHLQGCQLQPESVDAAIGPIDEPDA